MIETEVKNMVYNFYRLNTEALIHDLTNLFFEEKVNSSMTKIPC